MNVPAPAAASTHEAPSVWLAHFPVALFTIVMGLAGLTIT